MRIPVQAEAGPGSFRLAFGHLLFPYPLASPELLTRIDASSAPLNAIPTWRRW